MIDRRTFLYRTGALALGASLTPLLRAQPKTGRLVFGIPAGAIGNELADGALEILSSRFDMDYRLEIVADRNTLEASERVKAAPADGTTLLQVQSSSMVLFPSMYRSLAYDPLKDFTPLALMGDYVYTLTLGPAVPASVTTLEGYLGWVEQNPEFRDIGYSLYGSQGHLAALVLMHSKAYGLMPQAYKAVKAMVADMRNQTLAACIMVAGNNAVLGGNGLRPIAVTGSQRQDIWPDIPTFLEAGLADLNIAGWYGWFAPAGLPAATAQALREKIKGMQATAEFKDLQKRLLLNPVSLEPEQIQERMRQEMSTYGKLMHGYGLKPID
ncbi:tripartite tricarboxylate transporter substrate-binding protein [Pseudomonas sp. RIT-PI-AD]|uniref:Bug family tripartite tricarboxylate transporter substrate binding protein n=1 Tax=Pseudomonas sp. RIT-PI-AD TaxID=3035294 RepID=UPI0021D9F3F9|nr:tripartite tricarboxylate transporter substrate-binding protein [Pseudomonas sp. RIT-PI-AD]